MEAKGLRLAYDEHKNYGIVGHIIVAPHRLYYQLEPKPFLSAFSVQLAVCVVIYTSLRIL
jgi:hypothetical protein